MNENNYWWEIKLEADCDEELLSIADISGSIGSCFDAPACLSAYYLSSEHADYWIEKLRELSKNFPTVRILGYGKIENRPWHTEWKEAFPPLSVGKDFTVLAPWHKGKEPEGKIPLYIYPATAFGTGYHESTQIALSLLEKYKSKVNGGKVADIGTGSGVLFIASLKLGAEFAYARDIDPTVLSEVINNMEENGISRSVADLAVGDLLKDFSYKVNVLTANILFEPLCTMLSDVAKVLCNDGIAIFAGLLLRERDDFIRCADSNGLILCDEMSCNEWWGAVFSLKISK